MSKNSSSNKPHELKPKNIYGAWGKYVSIDLNGCNNYVNNEKKIEKFVDGLCKKINMVRHGILFLDKFGEGELYGTSAMQFIKTSSITMHFDTQKGKNYMAFIDIFSCKDFNEYEAETFCKNYFKAKESRLKVYLRGKGWLKKKEVFLV